MVKNPSSINLKILYLRKILRKIKNFNGGCIYGKLGIGVVKYEISSNLKWNGQFKQISTLRINSDVLTTYNIKTKKVTEERIRIKKNDSYYTQIEQIQEEIIIKSGGKNFLKANFTVLCQKYACDFMMKSERFFHRTSFDKKDQVFIFSGVSYYLDKDQISQQKDVVDCEVFNMQYNTFKGIQKIQRPVSLFGSGVVNSQAFIFGGYTWKQKIYSDIIQQYDALTDNWSLSMNKLSMGATTSAIYIPYTQSFFIFANDSILDNQIWDFKIIEVQEEKFPSGLSDYNYTQPILGSNGVFQFNSKSDLYRYSFSNGKWNLC